MTDARGHYTNPTVDDDDLIDPDDGMILAIVPTHNQLRRYTTDIYNS